MRFAGVDAARPFVAAGSPMLEWPEGRPAPELPAGRGGIAVRTWYGSRWDRRYPETARNVGVDGRPLWHGWGRMVAVVEPGEHLVEVRGERVEGARLVTVRSGELVELEYVGPRNWGACGLLAASPVREVGATMRPWLVAFGVLMSALLCLPYTELADAVGKGPRFTILTIAALAATVAIPLLWTRFRSRRDAAYRAAKSHDARPVSDGWFLGDTPRSTPSPPPGFGGVLVVARLRHSLTTGQPTAGNPHAWLPSPRLHVDGRDQPISWACWWYPLPAGSHEITFAPAAPDLPDDVEPELTPVTLRVDIREGVTRRLTIRTRAWTALRSAYRDGEPTTEVAGHRQKVEARLD